jgi:hypothetical protein
MRLFFVDGAMMTRAQCSRTNSNIKLGGVRPPQDSHNTSERSGRDVMSASSVNRRARVEITNEGFEPVVLVRPQSSSPPLLPRML